MAIKHPDGWILTTQILGGNEYKEENPTKTEPEGWIVGDGSQNTEVSPINGNQITTGTITADSINVTELSALSADLGTITAGTITLGTDGFIRGGQTGYNTGTGFFLGYDTSAYKFSIGDPAGDNLTWDGSNLAISGNVIDVTTFQLAGSTVTSDATELNILTGAEITATELNQIPGYSRAGTYFTQLVPWIAPPVTLWTSINTPTYGYEVLTCSNAGAYRSLQLMSGSGFQGLFWSNNKRVIVECRADFSDPASGADHGFGFNSNPTDAGSWRHNDATDNVAAFVIDDAGTGTIYAKTSNTSNVEATDVTSGITLGNINSYRIDADLNGNTVYYYINGNLVATHSTYVPTAASAIAVAVRHSGVSGSAAFSQIMISQEI